MADENQDQAEELTPAQQEQAFSAGFQNVQSEETAEETPAKQSAAAAQEQPPAEPVADAPAQPDDAGQAAEAATEYEKIMEGLSTRMRNLEGRMGGTMSKLDAIAEKMQPQPPATDQQPPTEAQQAQDEQEQNEADLKKLLDDYPELKPVVDRLLGMNERLATLSGQPAQPGITAEQVSAVAASVTDERLEAKRLDDKHEDWRQVVKTNEWITFALEGGPTIQDYMAFNKMPEQAQNEILTQWQTTMPEWWDKKGKGIFSFNATDAIRLLDDYKNQGKQQQASQQRQEQQRRTQKKLRAAVMPTGTGGEAVTGALSDEEAFAAGFKNVNQHR